ncbi:MAG: hypothetical protein ACO1NW_14025 [Chitinophagaceae bacterium]
MKKLITYLLALLAGTQFLLAQTPELIREIHGDFIDFTTDNIGNTYLLTRQNQLKKYNPDGDSLSVFNDVKRFGKLYSMDASNPLKLVLYYRDFSTVVELDRLLNVRNTIDLKKLNIFQPKAVGLSNDNNIWVYDELEAQLKKIGQDGTLRSATTDLRQALDSLPSPTVLSDQDALVYLYDTTKGVYLFDYFGTLKNRLPFRGWQDFQVLGKFMFGRKNTILYRYETGSLQLQEQDLAAILQDVLKLRVNMQRLYVLHPGKLQVYRL